jgi:hypothetical protein
MRDWRLVKRVCQKTARFLFHDFVYLLGLEYFRFILVLIGSFMVITNLPNSFNSSGFMSWAFELRLYIMFYKTKFGSEKDQACLKT